MILWTDKRERGAGNGGNGGNRGALGGTAGATDKSLGQNLKSNKLNN